MGRIDLSGHVDVVHGALNPEIFYSEEIYAAELEHLFARAWLFLAHESMLKKTGDFIQTYMGEDPVLVVRQRDGSVNAFMNQCRHRGMRICRADEGNIKAFTCTYHGWTYDIGGRLINVPHEEDGYHNELDKEAWGPIQVAQITNYKGFIFATWDADAPSFEEYLGDMAYYFDAFAEQYVGGFEVVGAHKWVIDCNWKFAAEQFASDAYHGQTTHASAHMVYDPARSGLDLEEYMKRQREMSRYSFSSSHGHGTGFSVGSGRVDVGEPGRVWEASILEDRAARLGEYRADGVRGHTTIFPNFSYLGNGSFRVWQPRGPRQIETWAWYTVPTEAPPEYKAWRRQNLMRTFSPAGMWEVDDGENWNEIEKVLRGHVARKHMFNAEMGIHGQVAFDQDGLPGKTLKQRFGEEAARGMYKRWADMTSGKSWQELDEIESQWRSTASERTKL